MQTVKVKGSRKSLMDLAGPKLESQASPRVSGRNVILYPLTIVLVLCLSFIPRRRSISMPPKSKRNAGGDKSKDVQETEEPLQAIVLTDSFETRFCPFTLEKPRVSVARSS